MKRLLLLSFLCATQFAVARTWDQINPLIGDQSYILKYGEAPNEFTPDQVRIATHLEYAEYVLRSKDVSEMSAVQIQKRTHLLDLLHEYWTRGVFPMNADVKYERRPCFIDGNGTICAVGYLVEQTAGHDVAELINERFMYNEILEMNDPVVINWIDECGLTQEECAIIQPSYGPRYVFDWQVSYGASYRIKDNFYHSFAVERVKYNGGRGYGSRNKNSRVGSGGFRFDLLNNGNFSAAIQYTREIRFHSKKYASLGFAPECFRYSKVWGMNFRPEFELHKTFRCFEVGLNYSYVIPIISESVYGAGRHDISARIGVNLSDVRFPKIPKKPKVEEPVDAGNALR